LLKLFTENYRSCSVEQWA